MMFNLMLVLKLNLFCIEVQKQNLNSVALSMNIRFPIGLLRTNSLLSLNSQKKLPKRSFQMYSPLFLYSIKLMILILMKPWVFSNKPQKPSIKKEVTFTSVPVKLNQEWDKDLLSIWGSTPTNFQLCTLQFQMKKTSKNSSCLKKSHMKTWSNLFRILLTEILMLFSKVNQFPQLKMEMLLLWWV